MIRKKMILEIEETELCFDVIGIVSSESHLEFVHFLNKNENFQFHRLDDLSINDASGEKHFIQFECLNEEWEQKLLLIKNKGDKGILAKEFKRMDYLLIIFSEDKSLTEDTLKRLQNFKMVQATVYFEKHLLSEKTLRIVNQ